MIRCLLFVISFFSLFNLLGQERVLISENDNLKIFESIISLNSEGNIFPSIYNGGLIYASVYNSKKYFFSKNQFNDQAFKIGSKSTTGPVAIFNEEIYFAANCKSKNSNRNYSRTIYKGILKGFKVENIEALSICNNNFSYFDPAISKDGKRMVVVSNEKGYPHLLELNRKSNNKWEKGEVIYIGHPDFQLINPSFYDKNTLYFSYNLYDGKVLSVNYIKEDGKLLVDSYEREQAAFNIYKIVKKKGKWDYPKKVEIFNSDFDDLSVIFLNEKSGYLNSFRYNDTENIYYFEMKD